jgi:hypothetical protein
MSYLPAFDSALKSMVDTIYDPIKHNIADSQCESPSSRSAEVGAVTTADL